jgi:hypothetical protein
MRRCAVIPTCKSSGSKNMSAATCGDELALLSSASDSEQPPCVTRVANSFASNRQDGNDNSASYSVGHRSPWQHQIILHPARVHLSLAFPR